MFILHPSLMTGGPILAFGIRAAVTFAAAVFRLGPMRSVLSTIGPKLGKAFLATARRMHSQSMKNSVIPVEGLIEGIVNLFRELSQAVATNQIRKLEKEANS